MPVKNHSTSRPDLSDHALLTEALADINLVVERNRATIDMSTLYWLTDAGREINLADRQLAGAA